MSTQLLLKANSETAEGPLLSLASDLVFPQPLTTLRTSDSCQASLLQPDLGGKPAETAECVAWEEPSARQVTVSSCWMSNSFKNRWTMGIPASNLASSLPASQRCCHTHLSSLSWARICLSLTTSTVFEVVLKDNERIGQAPCRTFSRW